MSFLERIVPRSHRGDPDASRAILRGESGATAIEYGLIVGLIALGILGALVTTKSSLNQDYNTIASGLAPANAGPPDLTASMSPRKAFWTGKVLSSYATSTSGTSITSTFTYKDGTVANLTRDSSNGAVSMSWVDPNYQNNGRPNGMRLTVNSAGTPSFYGLYGYNTAGTVITDTYTSSPGFGFSGNPPVPTYYDTTYYNANGSFGSITRNQSAGALAPAAADGYNDYRYFSDITK